MEDYLKYTLAISVVLVGSWALTSQSPDITPAEKPENIVYISTDGLSANHLPCYGYNRNTAPNICNLNNSVVYENAYTTSIWERLSIPSMMTGRYPHRVNVINSHTPLNTEYKTIAEVVKSKGYRTIMRMGNPFFPQETNADQGFDSYESIGSVPSGEGPSEFQKNLDGEKLYYRLHVLGSHDPFNPSPRYYNYSDYQYIKEINTSLSTKVHKHRARYRETLNTSIFENISAEERRKIIDHYDENIRALDQYIGYYIDKLKEEDEYRDSMIIITSDYGMSFNDFNRSIWNHMNTNPSTSRVPLVVKYPEADRSSRSEKLVSIMDPFKIILNEVDGSLDYELDAIDPRKQSRDLHYTYTKRGSSITNSTHFAFNNLLRRTWSYYKIHNNKFRSVEKAFPDLKGSLSSFTWSFQNTEYNTTDFGYEDIRG